MFVTLLIVFVCSFLAFSISAISGGGAGLVMMPILSNLLPVSQVPSSISIGTFASSASRIIIFRKNISWKIVRYFLPAALPAVWLGAWLLKFINPFYLEVGMGVFLVINLPFVFKKQLAEVEKPPAPAYLLSIIGFLAGFLSGLTGAVGLLFNKFYLRHGLNKEEIIATRAANEIVLHLVKIVLYALFGLITREVIYIGLVIAVSAFLSTFFMKKVLPFVTELFFKRIGYLAMVLSGVFMLTQATRNLMHMNDGAVSFNLVSKGIESKLHWKNASYSLEFKYDEGFEFEQVVGLEDLTEAQQLLVLKEQKGADEFVLEVVHSVHATSYEAYYFVKGKLRNKIDIMQE